MQQHETNAPASDTDLAGLFGTLFDYKWSIILITLLGIALAFAYLALAAPTYTASSTLLIDPRSRKIVAEDVVEGSIGLDQQLVQSQIGIITSNKIMRRVVEKLNLQNDEEFSATPNPIIQRFLKRPMIVDPVLRASTALAQHIKVKRPLKTYLVNIEASSGSAEKAQLIVQTLVDTYLDFLVQSKTEEAQRANKLIAARLSELRSRVRRDEARIDDYRKANKILSSLGSSVTEREFTQYNTDLAAARTAVANAKARLEETRAALASNAGPQNLSESVNSPLIQRLRQQYSRISQRVSSLSSQMLPGHPVLASARSQLREVASQVRAELRRISATAQSDLNIATKKERQLVQLVNEAKAKLDRSNTSNIRLRELEQEWETSRALLRTFLTRAKETEEQIKLSTTTARVVSPPTLPYKPSWPIPLLVLALGTIGGFTIGTARALVSDHLRRRRMAEAAAAAPPPQSPPHMAAHKAAGASLSAARRRDFPARAASRRAAGVTRPPRRNSFLGLPVAAKLPDILSGSANSAAAKGRSPLAQNSSGLGKLNTADVAAALSAPKDASQRAFRSKIKALYQDLIDRDPSERIVLLASPLSGYGVSSIALSLTFMAIENKKSVLLIDSAASSAGLSLTFAEETASRTATIPRNVNELAALIRTDADLGAWFLPLAFFKLRAMPELKTRRLNQMIDKLAQDYDLVIIDAGSVMDDDAPGPLVTNAADVYLVNRPGVLPDDVVELAVEQIAPDRTRLTGVIEVVGPA